MCDGGQALIHPKEEGCGHNRPCLAPGIQTAKVRLWEGGCRRLKADQASGTDGDYSLLSDRLDLLLVECGHCPVRLAQHVLETNHTPAS